MEFGYIGYHLECGPSKYYSCQFWFKLVVSDKPYFCNWQKWKKNWFEKYPGICFKELLIMPLLLNLSPFWFQIKLLLSHLEFSIFSNHSHLGWSSDISDTVRMGTTPGLFKAWLILAQWFLRRRLKCKKK